MTELGSALNNAVSSLRRIVPSFKPMQADTSKLSNISELQAQKNALNDPSEIARFRDVKLHALIRKDGEVIAVQYQDGMTELHGIAEKWKPKTDSKDGRVQDLVNFLGAGVTVERFAGRPDAPTRGQYEDGLLFSKADLKAGRRVNFTV